MVQTTFRFGELEAILADINEIPSAQRTSFQARLKDIQRHGLLRMETLPRGKSAAYGLRELALLAVSIEMCQLGLSTKRAVEVMLADEYPLWMAVMMAARAIEGRPEVFNMDQGDVGNDSDRELWGFSPDWNDAKDTDPLSMFLYFDPAVLAPWGPGGDDSEDTASATFFYAGSGIVSEMISRWTTGPTRRLALINVTKLLFDMSAYLAGADGLAVCKGFGEAADAEIHRGDFDLDGWLAHVTEAMGMMVAARPDRELPWMPLEEVAADGTGAAFLIPVPQVTPEGAQEWEKDAQRPDMIIRIPGQRELRVDNKVSPLADIPQAGIQSRLDELAEKPYHNQFADRSNWTVLYVPSETFLASAVAADHGLIARALQQNVLIATPTIFLNLLAEVEKAWTDYRAEFPDLGDDEFQTLDVEREHWQDPNYRNNPGLPPRVGANPKETANGNR